MVYNTRTQILSTMLLDECLHIYLSHSHHSDLYVGQDQHPAGSSLLFSQCRPCPTPLTFLAMDTFALKLPVIGITLYAFLRLSFIQHLAWILSL